MKLFIVTKEAKCKVVNVEDKRINSILTGLKKVGEYSNYAFAYSDGKAHMQLHNPNFNTWNGKDNGKFAKYLPDARIKKTYKDCIELIKKAAK
jgi:hypothetical protein